MQRLLLLGLGAIIVLAAGCPRQTEDTNVPPTVQLPSKKGANQPAEAKKYTIAVVPKGTTHMFWKTVKAGAEAAGKELGAEIQWKGPADELDVARQVSIIENFITAKVDAIVMAACDADALVKYVQQALAASIPVITIDSGISSDDALSFVATDNVEGARQAGEKLIELIGGKGKVGIIPFIKGAATSDMREEGFKKAIEANPQVKLVATLFSNSDAEEGMKAAENMLTSHPDIAGIFAANEPGAIGAAQAIKQRGLAGKVKLVGFDAAEAEIDALQEGVIQALVVQDPFEMGYQGVKFAVDAIEGREVPKRFDTGVELVTLDNFSDPEIQKLLFPTVE
ncbi:MAG: ABC transporter substrate-binding protein [Candidatus Zipacnadales bacterium]